jgi:hypothetical protein
MSNVMGFSFNDFAINIASTETNKNRTTPEDYLARFELAISKVWAVPLVTQTVSRPVEIAQRRGTKVITKLSVAALWLLVVANMLFALFALVLAILATQSTAPEIHQVQTRLCTAGIVAQLFDPDHARRAAEGDYELFREEVAGDERERVAKRVYVRRTLPGGAEFVTHDVHERGVEDGNNTRSVSSR